MNESHGLSTQIKSIATQEDWNSADLGLTSPVMQILFEPKRAAFIVQRVYPTFTP